MMAAQFLSLHSPVRLVAVLAIVLYVLYRVYKHVFVRYPYPLPPSPPGEPLLGHYRTLPMENPHLKHLEYSKKYNSDIVYFNSLGNHIIVLNSTKAANDLLDKRGANYQDRPRFVLFELMGWGLTLTFLPYGDRFKLHRSLLQTGFTKSAIVNYRPIQLDEARQAVFGIYKNPGDWENRLRRFASSIVLRIGFGVAIKSDDDKYITIARDANMATAGGGNPATSLMDYLPVFKPVWQHLPEFLNFSAPLKHVRTRGWAIKRLHDEPFADIKAEFDAGSMNPSFAYKLLTNYYENEKKGEPSQITMADIQGASAAVFIAGANSVSIRCQLNQQSC